MEPNKYVCILKRSFACNTREAVFLQHGIKNEHISLRDFKKEKKYKTYFKRIYIINQIFYHDNDVIEYCLIPLDATITRISLMLNRKKRKINNVAHLLKIDKYEKWFIYKN